MNNSTHGMLYLNKMYMRRANGLYVYDYLFVNFEKIKTIFQIFERDFLKTVKCKPI